MLTLPIKKKWFDMILSGEKKEEYRENKPYYTSRFIGILAPYWKDFPSGEQFFLEECHSGWYDGEPFEVCFRNGYSSHSPSFVATVTLSIGEGKPEWGATPGEEYYRLHIHSILSK